MTSIADRPRYFPGEGAEGLLAVERDFVTEGVERGTRGLALSGGGIRSAAYAMGVLQALVAGGKLSAFDYLSSVSGGGYLASSLTYFLHTGLPTGAGAPAGTSEADFPFGSRRRDGAVPEVQNRILNFIRQQASYLSPTPRLGILSSIAVVTRAAFLSLLVYFSLLASVFGLLLEARYFEPLDAGFGVRLVPAVVVPVGIATLLAVLSVFYVGLVLIQRFSGVRRFLADSGGYRSRTRVQVGIGVVLRGFVATALLGALGLLYGFTERLRDEVATWQPLALSLGSTLLGSWLGAFERTGERREKTTLLRTFVALGLVTTGLLLTAFFVADTLHRKLSGGPLVFVGLLAFGFLFGLVGNVNYLGLHRMYRDRLMELFMAEPRAIREQRWFPATTADGLGLHRVAGVERGRVLRPYPLVNTNVVLVSSERGRQRIRGGDSFVLSPLYVGSCSTGWLRSDHYMRADRGGRGMTLPSAMAISGAAVNPNTGVAGRGLTRAGLSSFLLALLNLRLGYWAPNPSTQRSSEPSFIRPGLFSLLGRGHDETRDNVELTDGGHFENLGLYELVRRRVAFVLVVDAGEDRGYAFSDLANAVERVRVDFGARVEFESSELAGLVPGSGPDVADVLDGRAPLAARPFARGIIRYADGTVGRIVLLKSTLFPGLPVDVLGYKLAAPDFPHQSTTDQFFDEHQFEAYRELGYYAGWKYLESEEAETARSESVAAGPE